MISLTLVKNHLHIPESIEDDDSLLEIYISAATESAEKYTGMYIRSRLLAESFCSFSESLIMRHPLNTVDSINYISDSGLAKSLPANQYQVIPSILYDKPQAGGRVLSDNVMGEIRPITDWPSIQPGKSAVQVVYNTGYSEEELPEDIKIAILTRVGQLNNDREATSATQIHEVPMTFHCLLNHYRALNLYGGESCAQG